MVYCNVPLTSKLYGCIAWNVHNTVFGSKGSAICAIAKVSMTKDNNA